MPTDAEQIVVTPGALAALSVALHALVRPGRRVLADSPTYPGALGAIDGTDRMVELVDAALAAGPTRADG